MIQLAVPLPSPELNPGHNDRYFFKPQRYRVSIYEGHESSTNLVHRATICTTFQDSINPPWVELTLPNTQRIPHIKQSCLFLSSWHNRAEWSVHSLLTPSSWTSTWVLFPEVFSFLRISCWVISCLECAKGKLSVSMLPAVWTEQ